MSRKQPIVFIVCSGLGRINRGYETFTRECFDALNHSQSFSLRLYKGAGPRDKNERSIFNVSRTTWAAKFLSSLFRKDPYWVEQLTFFISLLSQVIFYRPNLIFYSDFLIGAWLWRFRQLTGSSYRLLFSNGAPNGPPFSRMDHVQQLLPMYIEQAKRHNTPLGIQTLLPYGIQINRDLSRSMRSRKDVTRRREMLPLDKKVIVSVGAIDTSHKRMDYVVREFSQLSSKDYFLLVLGQQTSESGTVLALAQQLLDADSYSFRAVKKTEVLEIVAACDFFFLASLKEGQPRVILEAISVGLLPIVHDYEVTRQTLNRFGIFLDLEQEGQLKRAVKFISKEDVNHEELIEFAWENYSWEKLKNRYEQMLINNLK